APLGSVAYGPGCGSGSVITATSKSAEAAKAVAGTSTNDAPGSRESSAKVMRIGSPPGSKQCAAVTNLVGATRNPEQRSLPETPSCPCRWSAAPTYVWTVSGEPPTTAPATDTAVSPAAIMHTIEERRIIPLSVSACAASRDIPRPGYPGWTLCGPGFGGLCGF